MWLSTTRWWYGSITEWTRSSIKTKTNVNENIFVKINSKFLCFYRLEDEVDRSSHHASTNVDLHVYTQKLENECRDLRCQLTQREKEKFELNEMIADFEIQVKGLSLHSRIFFFVLDQTSS
jgi:hypothetical protein